MPELLNGEQVFTSCTQGGPIFVHVKNGQIVRIRPIVFDDKEKVPGWTIKAQGRNFTAPRRVTLAPYVLSQKSRTYSENRIRYPMIRTDFDPKGERHPENRGKSGYKKISWDKALDIVADEMKRIRKQYGPEAIMSRASSHHEWGFVGYKFGAWSRFFNLIGFTDIFDNPDSWEGWQWGGAHCAGYYWRLGIPEQWDLLEDALKHTELIIHWGDDPDAVYGVYGGQESAVWRLWLRELGVKQIFIDPFCNYSAGIQASKWIAPRPGTDSALALAIAYVWLQEGTYDKKYIQEKTLGFDEFRKYVMGEEDGIPKTPQWAAEKSAIPARDIIALAKEWASKRTMLSGGTRGGFGGASRTAYAHEWARLMELLQAMQGWGKPGVNIWGTATGVPYNHDFKFAGYADNGPWFLNPVAKKPTFNPVSQRVYRLLIPDAILNPPIKWLSEGFCGQSIEQQFIPYVYPEPGKSEVKMFYRYGGSFIGTMTDTSRYVDMYQSPKLEFVVNQDVWWCTETRFADIILPACSNFERNDIGEWGNSGGYSYGADSCNRRMIIYQKKCIEPLYESRSDYWIFTELSERLGVKEDFTEGNTEEDWIEKTFHNSDMPKYISFEEFKKKGYFVVPLPEDYKRYTALRWYYEGRDNDSPSPFDPKKNTAKSKELGTYSGKIEFVSQSLKTHFPDDEERPPMPHYIPSWEGHESKLAEKYPLQLIAPHPRFSFHTHHDVHSPWLSEIPIHRVFKDGYPYRTARIHPRDAGSRGIKQGDIIKLYNDRGAVLGIADVTERVKPGVIHMYTSSGKYDPLTPGKKDSVDRGGCINILTSVRMMSKNAPGMAPNSTLLEVEKWGA